MAEKETELLQAVLDARKDVENSEADLSEANELKQKAEAALIEHMDNADLKSFKSTIFNCIAVRKETLYVSIEKEKKEDAMKWIEEDCGRGDMIKPSIHNRTLTSFISERLKKGEAIPQEMFRYFFKPELAISYNK